MSGQTRECLAASKSERTVRAYHSDLADLEAWWVRLSCLHEGPTMSRPKGFEAKEIAVD